MRSRTTRLFFSVLSFVFAAGLFIYGVLATVTISANLSGSFNFQVPKDNFTLKINAYMSGHSGPDIAYPLNQFDHQNAAYPWVLNDKIHFKENSEGELEDIVFTFELENLNEELLEVGKSGRVFVSYEMGADTDTLHIELTPSENLKNGITLEALKSVDENNPGEPAAQTDNKTTFTVTLSSKNPTPNQTFNAKFNFTIKFELEELQ